MTFQVLDQIPQLDLVLDMQREMSQAQTPAEMLYAFARYFRDLTDVRFLLTLDVQALPFGHYRLLDRIVLDGAPLSIDQIQQFCRRAMPFEAIPVHQSPVLSKLVEATSPVAAWSIDPKSDPELGFCSEDKIDCLSVPIFIDGQIVEWLVVLRDPGQPVDDMQLRIGVANFNLLARSLRQLGLNAEIKALHQDLQTQLNEVGQVQKSLLPEIPPQLPGLDIAVHYQPCAVAGGDYYDFRCFDPNRLGIVVADVSGHGPGSAVMMAMLKTALSVYRLSNSPPETVVPEINRILYDGLRNGNFVTAFFVVIDVQKGQGSYANAGHPPARLRRANGDIVLLDADASPPLGLVPDLQGRGGYFQLEKGDTLVMFTDGLIEATDPSGAQFGLAGLDSVLNCQNGSAEICLNAIKIALADHLDARKLSDDLCVLALHRE